MGSAVVLMMMVKPGLLNWQGTLLIDR